MPASLGQNFLKDKEIVNKIISAASLNEDDFVIEIGPGKGILTGELAKYAGKVLAIEIDIDLIEPLRKKFSHQKNIAIIHSDILKINLTELLGNEVFKQYKIIANIPYYITSPIIRLFLESGMPPQEMILMVQKEVAERIVAKPGQMSILAVSVQYYAEAEILFDVPREAFSPVPEVDSTIIKIIPSSSSSNNFRKLGSRKQFFRIVKAGFSAKRKTLVNNLSHGLRLDKKKVEEKIKAAGFLPTVRAQELSVEDWKKMTKIF